MSTSAVREVQKALPRLAHALLAQQRGLKRRAALIAVPLEHGRPPRPALGQHQCGQLDDGVQPVQVFPTPDTTNCSRAIPDPAVDSNDKKPNRNTNVLEWLETRRNFKGAMRCVRFVGRVPGHPEPGSQWPSCGARASNRCSPAKTSAAPGTAQRADPRQHTLLGKDCPMTVSPSMEAVDYLKRTAAARASISPSMRLTTGLTKVATRTIWQRRSVRMNLPAAFGN